MRSYLRSRGIRFNDIVAIYDQRRAWRPLNSPFTVCPTGISIPCYHSLMIVRRIRAILKVEKETGLFEGGKKAERILGFDRHGERGRRSKVASVQAHQAANGARLLAEVSRGYESGRETFPRVAGPGKHLIGVR